ncbi:MAG: hypothetical protein K9N06_10530 [Candidatus Cloacimonetes bacterium]|nr:hypothetical protein [Candidatus Cloacimonadota bacterium]
MSNDLHSKLKKLQQEFERTLILNPTENIPWKMNYDATFTEGLYISEDARGKSSRIVFAGRNNMHIVMTSLYHKWEKALSAKASSFKIYSGLHAHIILFMSVASIGDKVLLLPEIAGGHYASEKMLNRLGLQVKTIPINRECFCVDITKTKALIENWHPEFIFIDRSDGLYYEDFSWLKSYTGCYKIFDASQYLSHIIAGDYINPFDMGMDLILTTLHKNYPGPQKAALFTKEKDELWLLIVNGIKSYVSNIHPLEVYKAVLTLPSRKTLRAYSQMMLKNAGVLESVLSTNGVPVITRDKKQKRTQQVWIPIADQNYAYRFFKRLEKAGILTNYTILPYGLGRGLRLGTAAATRQGLTPDKSVIIGKLISDIYHSDKLTDTLLQRSAKEIHLIKNHLDSNLITAIQ